MNTSNKRQSSQSTVRALQIMECLAYNHTPMRLQELAKQTNLTQPTVLRYLYALEDANYVYQNEETSRYSLTWRVCLLSNNVNSLLGLRNIANPFINKLANSMSLGACLVIVQNHECMYLDCIDNPNSPTLQRIGKHAPLHATGSGKILLAQYSNDELDTYINDIGLTRYTEQTITDPAILRQELSKIRRQDFAMDEEECEIGLRCISCPLRDYSGQIIAAISVFGRVQDITDTRLHTEIFEQLRSSANAISLRLGYLPKA